MRGGRAAGVVAGGLVLILTSCLVDAGPSAPEPALIEWAGVPTEAHIGASVTYLMPDGSTLEVETEGYRLVTPAGWSGELVILGSDRYGMFVASFMRQDGLPDGCYVENDLGVDRGAHIETRGILWPKRATFQAAEAVAPNTRFPAGTRFCFDGTGQIVSTVAP